MSLFNRRKGWRKSPLRFLRLAVVGVSVALFGLAAIIWAVAAHDRADDYDVSLADVPVPSFEQRDIGFVPAYDGQRTLPLVAGAIVDIDGSGPEEIYFGRGIDDPDAIFAYENGAFVDVTERTGWVKELPDTMYGAIAEGAGCVARRCRKGYRCAMSRPCRSSRSWRSSSRVRIAAPAICTMHRCRTLSSGIVAPGRRQMPGRVSANGAMGVNRG